MASGRYYIGVHKTSDQDDGYLGSGRWAVAAVRKYGSQAFVKLVLFLYEAPGEAYDKEYELVAASKDDPLCMNLRSGGKGGWDYTNEIYSPVRRKEAGRANAKAAWARAEYRDRLADTYPNRVYTAVQLRGLTPQGFLGRKHRPETIIKMRAAHSEHVGPKNSQYGTRWISRPGELPKKLLPGNELPSGWSYGRVSL